MSSASTQSAEGKICCSCRQSVSGKKRLKDAHGQYWCIPCAEREETKKHGGKVECPDCHRMMREDAMIAVELTKVCPTCHKERLAIAKKNPAIRSARYDAEYRKNELRKIKTMGCFVVGLVLLAAWQFDLIPGMNGGEEQSWVRQLMWTAIMLGLVTIAFLVGIVLWVKKNF